MCNEKKDVRNKKWFIAIEVLVGITAIVGYGVKDVANTIDGCRTGKIKKIRDDAAELFKNTVNDTLALELPIRSFYKVHEKMPDDEVGYRLLVERANAIVWANGFRYDRVAEKLLEEAVGLSERPYEAKNRLRDIKRLKP